MAKNRKRTLGLPPMLRPQLSRTPLKILALSAIKCKTHKQSGFCGCQEQGVEVFRERRASKMSIRLQPLALAILSTLPLSITCPMCKVVSARNALKLGHKPWCTRGASARVFSGSKPAPQKMRHGGKRENLSCLARATTYEEGSYDA